MKRSERRGNLNGERVICETQESLHALPSSRRKRAEWEKLQKWEEEERRGVDSKWKSSGQEKGELG